MDEQRHTVVQHWVSVGDMLVLLVSVITTVAGLGFTYGGLSRHVDALSEQVASLQQRPITPLAAQELAAVKSRMDSAEESIQQSREDAAEFRREVRESLERIETKLDSHDRNR